MPKVAQIPVFTPNYPHHRAGENTLMPTWERIGGLPDYSGRDVVMAFVDSGFYAHQDIASRILLHVDASTNHVIEQPGVFETSDLSWHGQMTSFIAAGDGRTSAGKYRGLASAAKLVLVKVSTPRGQIKERDILRGLRWILDAHRRLNIRVVNISVGGDNVSDDANHPLHRTIQKLVEAGIFVVAASGNRDADWLLPPASAAAAFTVGGLDDQNSRDEKIWKLYHHNYGKGHDGNRKPELVAPAAWLASPIMPGTSVEREARWLAPLLSAPTPTQIENLIKEGHSELGLDWKQGAEPDDTLYKRLQQRINAHKLIDAHHQHVDGTSVAAPIVASVAAQMIEANPRLTPEEIRAILVTTARPLAHLPAHRQGAGLLNAAEAVRKAAQT